MSLQLEEKKILCTQTLLRDLVLRDVSLGVVTKSPTIIDLVKCNDVTLYYEGKCWLLGITPTDLQVKGIYKWLLKTTGTS